MLTNMRKPMLSACLTALTVNLFLSSFSPLLAQSTVGNGTLFTPSAGQRENYGIANYSQSANSNSGSAFPTHHFSRASSHSTGIGGSTIGTENVTSESSPATYSSSMVRESAPQFRTPRLSDPYAVNFVSPAMSSFSPALPGTERPGALVSPFSASYGTSTGSSSLESLPSYSNQPSLNKMMRFDSFNKF